MTLLKQTSLFTEDKLTFSQEDSLANHIHQQEKDLGKPMKDTSFHICLDALKRSNPDGLLAKMFVDLLTGMEGWYSTRCTMIWKGKAMKSNRFLFQLQVSTHPTKDIESGLLPTPLASEGGKMSGSPTENQMSLTKMARQAILPTPTTSDQYYGTAKKNEKFNRDSNLNHYIAYRNGKPSQLNPLFVEEMMGFPENWTTLPFLNGETNQSKPTETQ